MDEELKYLAMDYFYPCKLLREEAQKRRHVLRESGAGSEDTGEFVAFYEMFLGTLFVVSEGFLELGMPEPTIEKLIIKHRDSLRLARNGIFHYQKNSRKRLQFFEVEHDRMNWAEDLFFMFEDLFQMLSIQGMIDEGSIKVDGDGIAISARDLQDRALKEEGNYEYRLDIIERAKLI